MIYAYMKQKHPELEAVPEKYKDFDALKAKDIVGMAMNKNDPLCLKTVEKFTENFGTETGNMALKVLPYGGIYLIGGVTGGIKDYLVHNSTFMDAFHNKGRLSEFMRSFQVVVVNPELDIGLLGA